FFQAEDGIRDKLVTGVQTCALPISSTSSTSLGLTGPVQVRLRDVVPSDVEDVEAFYISELLPHRTELDLAYLSDPSLIATISLRSEERRVGKEGSSWWAQDREKERA